MFYRTRDSRELQHVNVVTSQLQTDLWNSVKSPAEAKPTQVVALAVSGMNDVLNSQGYTQAAWWNRIPPGAWCLMAAVAICSNVLIGYDSHRARTRVIRLLVLPLVLCTAFYAIADIDGPRRGAIRVHPQNLLSLAKSLHGQLEIPAP